MTFQELVILILLALVAYVIFKLSLAILIVVIVLIVGYYLFSLVVDKPKYVEYFRKDIIPYENNRLATYVDFPHNQKTVVPSKISEYCVHKRLGENQDLMTAILQCRTA